MTGIVTGVSWGHLRQLDDIGERFESSLGDESGHPDDDSPSYDEEQGENQQDRLAGLRCIHVEDCARGLSRRPQAGSRTLTGVLKRKGMLRILISRSGPFPMICPLRKFLGRLPPRVPDKGFPVALSPLRPCTVAGEVPRPVL